APLYRGQCCESSSRQENDDENERTEVRSQESGARSQESESAGDQRSSIPSFHHPITPSLHHSVSPPHRSFPQQRIWFLGADVQRPDGGVAVPAGGGVCRVAAGERAAAAYLRARTGSAGQRADVSVFWRRRNFPSGSG